MAISKNVESIPEEEEEEEITLIESTSGISLKDAHTFKVLEGPDRDREIYVYKEMIEKKLIIGSKGEKRKDIELSDESLFDYSASLEIEDEWLCINLEDERGELFVNDKSLLKKGLEDGDIIKLGNTVMEYKYGKGQQKQFIEIVEGLDLDKRFPLVKEIISIGRKAKKGPKKEIELSKKDRSISRKHAHLEKRGDQYFLVNEKEGNITLLNGVQVIEPRPLVNGDKIKMGNDTILLFKEMTPPLIEREIDEQTIYIKPSEIMDIDEQTVFFKPKKPKKLEEEKLEFTRDTIEEVSETEKVDTPDEMPEEELAQIGDIEEIDDQEDSEPVDITVEIPKEDPPIDQTEKIDNEEDSDSEKVDTTEEILKEELNLTEKGHTEEIDNEEDSDSEKVDTTEEILKEELNLTEKDYTEKIDNKEDRVPQIIDITEGNSKRKKV